MFWIGVLIKFESLDLCGKGFVLVVWIMIVFCGSLCGMVKDKGNEG